MIPLQKLYPKMWRSKRLRKKLRANSFHYIAKKRKPKDIGGFMGCYLDSAYECLATEIRKKDYLLSKIDSSGWSGNWAPMRFTSTIVVPR